MMKLMSRGAWMAIAIGACVFSSCSNEKDYYDPNFEKELAAKNFQAMLGEGVIIDKNHTWETVKNVEVSLPINYGTNANFSVTYYANNKIVGTAKVRDGQTLTSTVSVPSYTETLSVSLSGDNGLGTVIKLNVVEGQSTSRAASRAASERVKYENPTVYPRVYPTTGESDWGWFGDTKYMNGGTASYVWPHEFYYVDGAITGKKVEISDAFVEDVKAVVPENALPAETRATIVQDFQIETVSDGPVTLHYVYGISQNAAAIGYFIYNDDPGEIQNMDISTDNLVNILAQEKYGRPIQQNDYAKGEGEITSNPTAASSDLKRCDKYVIIDNMQSAGLETGAEIQLTYYDEEGNPSENFPAGTKIGFFIVPDANADHSTGTIDTRHAVYSFSKMNVEPHESKGGYFSNGWNDDTYATSHTAVFKLGENIVVGFEDANNYDSVDFDYNDFLFTLEGNFNTVPEVDDPTPETPDPTPETPDPEVQYFTYCFEDMDKNGGDYDFNDVVLYVSAPVNGKVTVILAAAGATYGLKVKLGNDYLFEGKEVHEKFGVDKDVMVNTGGVEKPYYAEIIDVGENWDIYSDGDFYIEVLDRDGLEVHVPAFQRGFTAGDVPYAIRVATEFVYPTERQRISAKYPAFIKWAEDATQEIDWYTK